MADAQILRFPIADHPDQHEVEALLARAIRLALSPTVAVDSAATELVEAAHHDRRLLTLALRRTERALALEWSNVVARAVDELRAARDCA